MITMKILFPTDFSEAAHNAFIYALKMASTFKTSVNVLHVYHKPEIKSMYVPHALEEFNSAYDLHKFSNFKDEISNLRELASSNGLEDIPLNFALEEGQNVVQTIIKYSNQEQVDFIVMGTTGAGAIRELFFGSVAAEILENSYCPVLAIPDKAKFDGNIDHIAFATDFKSESFQPLQWAIKFSENFNSKLHLVNVDTAHTEFYLGRMDIVKSMFSDNERLVFHVLPGNDVEKELTSFFDQEKIDFLIMVTHQRNWLQELFQYSRTKNLSHQSRIPVMSVK